MPPFPPTEPARLEALRRYQVLNTASEQAFDEITLLAAHVCIAPLVTIALVDAERVWFKSKVGLTMPGTPRETSFATHAILQPDLFTVEDTQQDERFARFPQVTAYPYIRALTSATLMTPDGFAIGSLEIMDRRPRKLRPEQEEALRALARQVVTQLELRRNLLELERLVAERTRSEAVLRESEGRFRGLVESAPDGIVIIRRDGRIQLVNTRLEALFGYGRDELVGQPIEVLIPERFRPVHVAHRDGYVAQPRRRNMGAGLDIRALRKDGRELRVEISLAPMLAGDGAEVVAFVREVPEKNAPRENKAGP